MSDHLLQLGRRISDDLLAPAAADVDVHGRFPADHLDRLAASGLYGLAGPVSSGGLGADRETSNRVVEELARGCLSTTFVWLQHLGVLRALAAAAAAGGQHLGPLLTSLCSGRVRAGVAVGGVRPGSAPLRARPSGTGWVLDGSVPWVTGWGLIDVLHVAALDEAGDVVWFLVDVPRTGSAVSGATTSMSAQLLPLTAVQASRTVTLQLRAHPVRAEALTSRTTYAEWQAADLTGLRGNGSLALGLAARCAHQHREGVPRPLAERIDLTRAALDKADAVADPTLLAQARAGAALLAWTAAASLVVDAGSRSVLTGCAPDRATREAAFLLVFATRPAIRESLAAGLLG